MAGWWPHRGRYLPVLTAREEEILALAAEGLSDPSIARQLVFNGSSRLTHIYAKLGIPEGANPRVWAVLTYLRAKTNAEKRRSPNTTTAH